MSHGLDESVVRRFWRYVDKRGKRECWPWTGGTNDDGYGKLFFKDGELRKQLLSHRVSFAVSRNVPLSELLIVRHSCDNPLCVNPSHLIHGSILDNIADRQSRNRQAKGEGNHNAKLTADQVKEIRRIHVPYQRPYLRELADRYGVTLDQIHRVARKKVWRHV